MIQLKTDLEQVISLTAELISGGGDEEGAEEYVEEVKASLKRFIPCVQEVVTPFYIVTYYIKWGNYFLDTQYDCANLNQFFLLLV